MEQVKLYDTTLRDGMGGQGMSLSVGEKLKVVQALDRLGVHFIEAGFPSSNPKEAELFGLLADLELSQATIAAFGMTRRRDVAAEDDEALRVLVESFAPVVCLVGKSWRLHVDKVIKVSAEENLAMIGDSLAFLRGQGKRPVFDAEHFFDGYRDDPSYALECVRVAAEPVSHRAPVRHADRGRRDSRNDAPQPREGSGRHSWPSDDHAARQARPERRRALQNA